jgi:hypothetical protein
MVSGRTIQIRDLHYRQECQAFGKLQKGKGTRALLTAALLFTIHMFPKCKYIILTDESSFQCSSAASEKGVVGLAEHNILVYANTWYQRLIPGLSLSTKRSPEISIYKYRSALLKLTSPKYKSSLTFEDLWKAAIRKGCGSKAASLWLHETHNPDLYNTLQSLFDNSSSLQAFFLQIHQTNKQLACRFFLETIPLIRRFIVLPILLDTIWECKVSTYMEAMRESQFEIHQTQEFDGLKFVPLERVFPSVRQQGGDGRWPHRYRDLGSPD